MRLPLAFSIALAATGTAGAAPTKYTLPELIQVATARSKHVGVARAEREVRLTQKREALWSWFPSLDVTGGIAPAIDVRCQAPLADQLLTLDQLKANGFSSHDDLRRRDCLNTVIPQNSQPLSNINFDAIRFINGVGFQGDLRLTAPIFTFGKIEFGERAAEHGVAYADTQINVAKSEVAMLAARAYWGLKASRAAIATIQDVRDRLKPWVDRIAQDLEASKPKYTLGDLRRGQIGLQQIELLLDDQQRNEAIARHGLTLLAGEDAEIDDAELEPVEIIEHPLDYYQAGALVHRPEVRGYGEGVAAFRSLARFSLAQMLPDLALVFTAGARQTTTSVEDSPSFYQSHINYQYFGLALGLRGHFDMGQLARYQHAQADAAVVAAQRDLALSGVSLEIAQGYNDLRESRRRIEITDKAQRLARGWFTSLDDNLEESRPQDLIDAARNYFEMRVRYLQAIHDTNVNVARMRRITGVDLAR